MKLRIDRDNFTWSYKPGFGAARDFDDLLQPIYDPDLSDRRIYSQLVGYFLTQSDSVQGNGQTSIHYIQRIVNIAQISDISST